MKNMTFLTNLELSIICLYINFSPLGDPKETAKISGDAFFTIPAIFNNSFLSFSNPIGGEYVPTMRSP